MRFAKTLVAMSFVVASMLGGCAYSGVAMDGDTVVVARNDGLLFGALRKVYVCQATPTGLANCSSSVSP